MLDWEPLTLCNTYYLRGINVLFSFGNLYLLYRLSAKLHDKEVVTINIIMMINVLVISIQK